MPNPSDPILTMPFLRILLPMATGIVAAHYFTLPWWALAGGLAVTYGLAWAGYRRRESWLYVSASILLTGMLLGQMHRPPDPLPKGEKLLMTFQVYENPVEKGRWQRTSADVGAFRRETDPPGAWTPARTKLLLWIDTCRRVEAGAQYAALAYVNPVDTVESGYATLMHARGFSGKSFVTPGRLLARSPYESRTPVWYARKLQDAAIRKIDRLGLPERERAVVAAMTVGDKRGMPPELWDAYSRIGAVHLLSVSGLHVAIVFSLVNILLYLLPAVRGGHIWKNVAAIAAIWLFAAAAGFSPSVIRSAFMFSGVQIALAGTLHRNSLNILFATAAVMLAIDPNYLFDISFQLSFVAVLAIFTLFRPLYAKARTRYPLLNAFNSAMIIGVVATLGTAPIIAHQFGNFPLVGILSNPLVVLTAHLTVMTTVLWLLVPVAPLAGLFGLVLEWLAKAQNVIVVWFSELPGASLGVHLPLWGVFMCYLAYILLYICFMPLKNQPVFSPTYDFSRF